MKNKQFLILLLLSLLLFSSCELIAQSIVGEKAQTITELMTGSKIIIEDLDENLITEFPIKVIGHYMNLENFEILSIPQNKNTDLRFKIDLCLVDGFIRKKKEYVDSFCIENISLGYYDDSSWKDDTIIYGKKENDYSKYTLEYLSSPEKNISSLYFQIRLFDSLKKEDSGEIIHLLYGFYYEE